MYYFGVVGAANGLSIMMDEETRSLWDPITGICFRGALKGYQLDMWPVFITTVQNELNTHQDTIVYVSTYKHILMPIFDQVYKFLLKLNKRGIIPPHFYLTLSQPPDNRLPKLTQGLGVIDGKNAKYYPLTDLPPGTNFMDTIGNRNIQISRKDASTMPVAEWPNSNALPMQLMSRWYGFAYTYPNCEIYQAKK